MPVKKNKETSKAIETLAESLRVFGNTLGEIFNDPDVKEKARIFASSVVDAAAKVVEEKVKSEETKAKFRDAGKAATTLGDSIKSHFKTSE